MRLDFLPLLLVLLLTSCQTPTAKSPTLEPAAEPATIEVSEHPAEPEPALAESEPPTADSATPLPIAGDDISWGSPRAPVTMLWFTDLECPFCKRVFPTLQQLMSDYQSDLRIVIKHYPLPFRKHNVSAAMAMIHVAKHGGDPLALEFLELVFERQRELSSKEVLVDWGRELGVSLDGAFDNEAYRERIEGDIALAKAVDAGGTPTFRINGLKLSGAQPIEKFKELIDKELIAARALRDAKLSPQQVYRARVKANLKQEPPSEPKRSQKKDDDTVWYVPIGQSAVLGKHTALVTLVEFADFQCPFCKRVQPTLERLRARYKDKLRLVFKHRPLPFHPRAKPATLLALEVQQQLGHQAFWDLVPQLFDNQNNLTDTTLIQLGTGAGLTAQQAQSALTTTQHDQRLLQDENLADDVTARGTPHFFINGRRLAGAQPESKFSELIDSELKRAEGMVRAGMPPAQVYDTLMKRAQRPTPPATQPVPVVARTQPVWGPKQAPVTLYLFADLECPFSARLLPTLQALRTQFNKQLKVVWYDLPLPFHKQARRAANAAHEVRRQLGDQAFFRFAELLFQNRGQLKDDTTMRQLAKAVKANPYQVMLAIQNDRHGAVIDLGSRTAQALGFRGTPSSSINGYVLTGAQPQRAFEKLILLALKDHQAGKLPQQLGAVPPTATP